MKLERFNYELPEELIAQEPVYPRDHSRLFVYDRRLERVTHRHFYNLPSMLTKNDMLVVNNTKVFPARLLGYKDTGGKIEVFLLREYAPGMWQVLIGGGRRKVGTVIKFTDQFQCEVVGKNRENVWLVAFNVHGQEFWQYITAYGQVPLPPYIKKPSTIAEYQTAYACETGSVAAPTAGFHFTDGLLAELKQRGVQIEEVTLHVGLGTFAGVTTERVEDHFMHSEWGQISAETAAKLNHAKGQGKRIIAVGTTSVRTLEYFTNDAGLLKSGGAWINLFIYPGYTYRFVQGIVTNFHLPKSTLLMLVAAFLSQQKKPDDGIALLHKIYQEAISQKYRFYSYGDGMLLL